MLAYKQEPCLVSCSKVGPRHLRACLLTLREKRKEEKKREKQHLDEKNKNKKKVKRSCLNGRRKEEKGKQAPTCALTGFLGGCNPQYFYIRDRRIFIEVKRAQKRQVEHGLNAAGSGILGEEVGV